MVIPIIIAYDVSNSSLHYEGKVEDASKVQTLLFSATLPVWVKQVHFPTDNLFQKI